MNPGNLRRIGNRFTNWLVVDLSLRKIWVRQLGWWHSQYMESHNPVMFQTTNQTLFGMITKKTWPALIMGVSQWGCDQNVAKWSLDTIAQHHHQIELAISALDVDAYYCLLLFCVLDVDFPSPNNGSVSFHMNFPRSPTVSWSENLDDVEGPEDKWDDRHQRQRDLSAEMIRVLTGQCYGNQGARTMLDILHVYFCLFLLISMQ